MAKMTTGGFEVVGFDRSWHGVTGGAASSTFNGARQGYGPTLPGALALPTPDGYRSPFAANGHYDWKEALDFGFQMLDRQKEQLLALQQRHEPIGDVRGRGLLLGVELVEDRQSKAPARELGLAVSRRCLELGASLNIGRRSVANIFRIAPPMTVTREQIDTAVSILDQALSECAA
jgi:4-aminobutyrate aminotransferase-like enzyme